MYFGFNNEPAVFHLAYWQPSPTLILLSSVPTPTLLKSISLEKDQSIDITRKDLPVQVHLRMIAISNAVYPLW